MYRNTTVGSLPLGLSRRLLATCSASLAACLIALCALALVGGLPLRAQVAGEGAINGQVTDKSGALVPHAKITATNTETGVATTRETTGSGDYSISPLQAGNYIVEVVAKGFQRQLQENVQVDSDQKVGLNIKLTVGGDTTTITITDAPPSLDTTNATLGGTIENELYTNLPLSMGGAPRNPTSFQYLMPGVQEGPPPTTSGGQQQGVYGGTGQTNLNENYIEGIPVSNIQSQGDNSPVAKAVSVDAVDQFSVQTNGASTAFGGAGVSNYTIKSGGNQLHGTIFDYIRNTAFDTWGYFSKVPSQGTGFATKPGEHQNSYGGSLGGPIIKDKLFFFGTYEGFSYTKTSNTPQYITVPTLVERTGNFTDQFGSSSPGIFDTTTAARGPFQGMLNGVPTYNVIPTSEISSISNYWQQALPAPTNLATVQNYLAGLPLQNQDYTIDARIDYTISARNKFSIVGVAGNQGFGSQPDYSNLQQLPKPYAAGSFTNSKTASGVLSYTFVASQTIINSLKYGYTRTWGELFSISQGTKYNSAAAGVGNLPPGNASQSMPNVTFQQGEVYTTPTAQEFNSALQPANWGSTANSGPIATNTYTVLDSLQWIKGKHNLTFGLQIQWLETNQGPYGGDSNVLQLTANGDDTAGFCNGCTLQSGGDAYASYLIGAWYDANVQTQSISDVGGRFRPDALYIQDDWRFSPKLTLNLGIRYDYLQPYHEAKDRIAFLNPTKLNPITGTPGVLEYAGFGAGPNPAYSPYICQCTVPVHPYNKNFEPRLGFAYAATQSFVIRGGYGIQLTHGGGSGGGANFQGTGNNGEYGAMTPWNQTGSNAVPGLFLNPSIPSTTQGISSVTTGQANYGSLPVWTQAGTSINPLAVTGNYNFTTQFSDHQNDYLCPTSDGQNCNPSKLNYSDPYYGGRGPQFINYNLGFQQMINKKAVLSINYAGSQTHFLNGGAGRGPALNGYSPDYDNLLRADLGATYASAATSVQAVLPNFKAPYANFSGPNATVAAALTAFPQFSTFTDLWGSTGNSSYNSVQMSVIQRPWHNLSGFINYTRSKSIDDTHGHRTQYPVGPQDGNFTRNYTGNQIDRGLGSFNQTNAFNATWVYAFPIGRGQTFFATNRIMGLIGGGWQLSGIYKYRDGYPLQITQGGGCNPDQGGAVGTQGTCMPDYSPGFDKRTARINGRWGRGPGANASNPNTIQYLNPAAFVCPDSPASAPTQTCGVTGSSGQGGSSIYSTYKLGNIASSAPDGLYGPGWWDMDLGIRRTFTVIERPTLHLTFQVEGDVINATNSTFFNTYTSSGKVPWENTCNSQSSISSCNNLAYGTVTGQNIQIPSRDWQFAGRFRF